MNILYAIDNNFVPQLATNICSLCENNKKINNFSFFLFSLKISQDNQKKLQELVKSYGYKLTIIEIDSLDEYFGFEFDSSGWPKVTLSRLLMGELLDKKIERILYLDADMIIRGDLSELWNTNLKEKIVGMSIEPTVNKNKISKLGLKNCPYYNSGMILVDLKKWREEDVQSEIFAFAQEYNQYLSAADQCVLNGVLKNRIYTISPKYNYYNIFDQYSYEFMCKLMDPCKYLSKPIYEAARKDPVIIHFLGEERPWRKGNTHKYKDEYKKYLNKTYWKNTSDETGWELYFVCWRIFNTITKPFPGVRYKIITSLIPFFIKYRKNKLNISKK